MRLFGKVGSYNGLIEKRLVGVSYIRPRDELQKCVGS